MSEQYRSDPYRGTQAGTDREQSSEEIKRNIEHTRHDMSEKIETIQQKLSPENLKAQAKDVMQDAVREGADTISEYIRTNSNELGRSLTDVVRRNPLPAALIGIGLGWLMMESMGSDEEDQYPIQRYQRYRRRPRSYSRRYDYDRAAFDGGDYGNDYGNDEGYDDEFYDDYVEYIDDIYDGDYDPTMEGDVSRSGMSRQYSSATAYRQSSDYPGRYQNDVDDDSSMIDEAQERVADAAHTVKDAISGAADQVQETAEGIGSAVGQKAEELGHKANRRARSARGTVRGQSQRMRSRGRQARHEAERRAHEAQHYAQETIQENPLMVGVGAFAVGALAGLLLPQTRMENKWMGEARDQIMDTAQEIGADMAHRAENVVEEVRPEVEKAAQQVAEDVRQTGQQAVENLKQTGQKAADKAQEAAQKAEESARTEGEKAKEDAKDRIRQENERQKTS